ncbi:PREDICTED: odorant receptor Or1-like [Dufourea novaeangliae]|uniref:odorant receptor Or1-like n=1 Tax=Dufourea novaeangliae TaxID=178035 RepID=UPI0007679312|nr:PREDICTED: odorant receptor Or1-like [Dufourea novaeangliae]
MHTLRLVSKILSIAGCWPPTSCSRRKKLLFDVYTVVVFLFIHTFTITLILDIFLIVDNLADFNDNFCITVPLLSTCFKLYSLLANRRNMETLLDTLEQEPFAPVNIDECEIRRRFHRLTEWNTTVYMILVKFCIMWMFVTSSTNYRLRKLKFRAWLPYDYSSTVLFNLTYFHQIVSALYAGLLGVSSETLYSGLLIHTHGQLELLEYRLKNIEKNENYSVKRFAARVNRGFKTIVSTQFLFSTLVVCFQLYQFTQMKRTMNSELLEMMIFLFTILIQVFYYCWYGNETKLKSLAIPDMIFGSNWTSFNNNTRKILLMIMRRATVPIEITSVFVVSMNLQTFVTIMKITYSSYNILKDSSKK